MTVLRNEELEVRTSNDVVRVRHLVRECAVEAGFTLVEQTKIVTAASEIARNTLEHGGGGTAEVQLLLDAGRRGVRLVCRDQGPGIPDLEQALRDGFTTGGGLGLGLGGARRLSSEFGIESRPGEGTRVIITRWR